MISREWFEYWWNEILLESRRRQREEDMPKHAIIVKGWLVFDTEEECDAVFDRLVKKFENDEKFDWIDLKDINVTEMQVIEGEEEEEKH